MNGVMPRESSCSTFAPDGHVHASHSGGEWVPSQAATDHPRLVGLHTQPSGRGIDHTAEQQKLRHVGVAGSAGEEQRCHSSLGGAVDVPQRRAPVRVRRVHILHSSESGGE
jgi:hypothetical protein